MGLMPILVYETASILLDGVIPASQSPISLPVKSTAPLSVKEHSVSVY